VRSMWKAAALTTERAVQLMAVLGLLVSIGYAIGVAVSWLVS